MGVSLQKAACYSAAAQQGAERAGHESSAPETKAGTSLRVLKDTELLCSSDGLFAPGNFIQTFLYFLFRPRTVWVLERRGRRLPRQSFPSPSLLAQGLISLCSSVPGFPQEAWQDWCCGWCRCSCCSLCPRYGSCSSLGWAGGESSWGAAGAGCLEMARKGRSCGSMGEPPACPAPWSQPSDIRNVPPAPTASSRRGNDLTGRQQKKPRRQVRASEILRAFSCKSPWWQRMRGARKTRKSDVSTELFLCRIFFKDFNKGVCTKKTQLHLHS